MARGGLAFVLMIACAGLLVLFGKIAWDALTTLPSKQEMQDASASVAKVIAERAPSAPQRTEPQQPADVRFIEKDGIVGIKIEGPLERAPSVARVDPLPAPEKVPDNYRLVVIQSAGLIDARSHRIELAHIDAPAAEFACKRADGSTWPCGMRARTALRRLIRRRSIDCFDIKADDAPSDDVRKAVCQVGNTDLSRWLVSNGWATPSDTAPEVWRELHDVAVAAGRGMHNPNGR